MAIFRSRMLLEDTRQQLDKHTLKHEWWESEGVPIVRTKLVVGDYSIVGINIFVDTKKDIYEIYGNITQAHDRFKRECVLARDIGAELIILVENDHGVTTIEDLARWKEPLDHFDMRRYKSRNRYAKRQSGERLAKAMITMHDRYGVRFEFCTPEDAARRVLELLDYWGGEDSGQRNGQGGD